MDWKDRICFVIDIPAANPQSVSPSLLSVGLISALEACPPTGPWCLYPCLYAALLSVSCTDRVPQHVAPPVCPLTLSPYPTALPGFALSVPGVWNRLQIQSPAPAEATATLNSAVLKFYKQKLHTWSIYLPESLSLIWWFQVQPQWVHLVVRYQVEHQRLYLWTSLQLRSL